MKHFKITQNNKEYICRRYTDHMISRMDNLEILDSFRNYFFREKMGYPIDTLEIEINKHCPEILEDHTVENVIGKGAEYAKNF